MSKNVSVSCKTCFSHICTKAKQFKSTAGIESSNYKVKCITLKTHNEAVGNLNNHVFQQAILCQQSPLRGNH